MSSCEKRGKEFIRICGNNPIRQCEPCQIDNLKGNFTNWTSGNEKIDDFIQEIQLKIHDEWDVVFEWIPYNQLNNIKEQNKGNFETVYTAMWKNGQLHYDSDKEELIRLPDKIVALKCLFSSQNNIKEFLNEV